MTNTLFSTRDYILYLYNLAGYDNILKYKYATWEMNPRVTRENCITDSDTEERDRALRDYGSDENYAL